MKLRSAKEIDSLPMGRILIGKNGHLMRLIDIEEHAFEAAEELLNHGLAVRVNTKAEVIWLAMRECNWGLAKNGYEAFHDEDIGAKAFEDDLMAG